MFVLVASSQEALGRSCLELGATNLFDEGLGWCSHRQAMKDCSVFNPNRGQVEGRGNALS